MKLLNIDWAQFLSTLEMYRTLQPGGRRMFIEQVRPSQPAPRKLLGPWFVKFVESGLMAPGVTGLNAQVKPEHREFSRAIRAMSRARVFTAPSQNSFMDYLNDNLTSTEIASIDGSYSYYSRMGHSDLDRMFGKVCSPAWVRQFLAAKNSDWERDFADPAQPRYFTSADIFSAAQKIVGIAAEADGPVETDHLPALCGNMAPETFSAALRGVLRYLLLFAAVQADSFEPVAGLWPGIAERLLNKPVPPPVPVAVDDPVYTTYLLDDMTSILAAAAAEPLRIRTGDMQLFEADYKNLTAGLGSLPEWFQQAFDIDGDRRIGYAVDILGLLRYLLHEGRPGSRYRFVVSAEGSKWLALEPKARLKSVFDSLRGAAGNDSSGFALVPGLHSTAAQVRKKVVPAIVSAYAGVPEDVFFRLSDFLEYHARSQLDVGAAVRGDLNQSLFGGRTWYPPSEEDLVTFWKNTLNSFLMARLIPLGGARLGIERGGKMICFSLTEAGRYLLGQAADFNIPAAQEARILIQPNFDVVFMTPSPRLEAELARFCERKGRHVGTLFKITRNSILTAAAAGMTPEQTLDLLRSNSPAGIPANVAAEIAGWFRRYREVSVRTATLVHCPDEQTATTVLAAMGKHATRLTATALELHESKIQSATAKKLREAGIFVRSR